MLEKRIPYKEKGIDYIDSLLDYTETNRSVSLDESIDHCNLTGIIDRTVIWATDLEEAMTQIGKISIRDFNEAERLRERVNQLTDKLGAAVKSAGDKCVCTKKTESSVKRK